MAQKHNEEPSNAPMTRLGKLQLDAQPRILRNVAFTADEFTADNPIMQLGELGYETDTNQLKIGDGVTAWADLPYVGGESGGAVSSVNGKTGAVVLSAEDVGAVPQVSELPTASESNLGNIVQYIGATTEDYTNGYFYKCATNDSGVGSGEIDITYWYPDPFTPPVTGSVDVDVFSAYLEQNNLAPISDGRIEITFQPGSNNIIFAYNVDTNWTQVYIPWTTVTTQAAEDIFANMGFDFDFSGIPTNMETSTGGHMPSATVYLWEEQPVMNNIGVYKDYSELPEPTAENVGTAYLMTPYDSETMTPYSPEMYMSVPYILNYIDGEAEVTGYNLTPETQPTDVMIDWATLESYLNSQETGFDWTNDTINISLNGDNYLEVIYNENFSASAGVQTDGTVANIQQELENVGISVDLTGYTQFQFLFLKLPTEKGYENRQVPAFVPTSGTGETDYVLKADGNGGTYWAAESGGGGLPDQTGHSGEFLTTDGTEASWATINALQNTATGPNSLTILGTASAYSNCVNIGNQSEASAGASVAIGEEAQAYNNDGSVVVGYNSRAWGGYGIAIGWQAESGASKAIQLGNGANSDANTFKVGNANGNFEIMDANGNLPADRLASTTGLADGNYRLRLTIASGVPTLSWVAE